MASRGLIVIYDTKLNPLSFDILDFLAACHFISQANEFDGRFSVALVCDDFRSVAVEREYSAEYCKQKVNSVLVQAAQECDWVDSVYVCRDADPRRFGSAYFPSIWRPNLTLADLPEEQWKIWPMTVKQVEALFSARSGFTQSGYTKSLAYEEIFRRRMQRDRKVVAIHMRAAAYNQSRDVPEGLFYNVAMMFKALGWTVVLIPDHDNIFQCDGWDSEFVVMSVGAVSLKWRVTIAEAVDFNICWNGGNVGVLAYSKAAFCMFGVLNDKNPVSSLSFFARKGPEVGRSPSWYAVNQVLDWLPAEQVKADYIVERSLRIINGV
jgi:hypothetical protein